MEAAFPNATIFDQLSVFASGEDPAGAESLTSSGGISIWRDDDPVHLTNTAHGDISIAGNAPEDLRRRRW